MHSRLADLVQEVLIKAVYFSFFSPTVELEFSTLFSSQALQRSTYAVHTLKELEVLSINILQKHMFLNVADWNSLQSSGIFFPPLFHSEIKHILFVNILIPIVRA